MRISYNFIKQKYRTHYGTRVFVVVGAIIICIISVMFIAMESNHVYDKYYMLDCNSRRLKHINATRDYFKMREGLHLSKLGRILFQNDIIPKGKEKNFTILIWKEGTSLERRHINYYSNLKHDPFEKCSVNNCNITYESSYLETADAVLFSLQKFDGPDYLPNGTIRSQKQRWIFLTDQSPFNTFRFREKNDWKDYNNIFNWSMSYKMQSDIPVPYGRTVASRNITKPHCINETVDEIKMRIPNFKEKRRDVLLAIKTADCGQQKRRVHYLEELKNHMTVDIFGRCANDSKKLCSKMSDHDCSELNNYIFYLSFENSNCEQFITEEIFWTAYSKGAVPIVMGPPVKDTELLLPPESYIHTKNFPDPGVLARYLLHLNATWNEELFGYHRWRKHFEVVNEHGYFGSPSVHYCRICEALNFNGETDNIYDNLAPLLSVERNCKE